MAKAIKPYVTEVWYSTDDRAATSRHETLAAALSVMSSRCREGGVRGTVSKMIGQYPRAVARYDVDGIK